MQEQGVGKDTRILCQDCTAAFLKWQLITVAISPCTHTGLSFYPISLLNWVSKDRHLWEMTSLTVCSHQNKLCFSWPRLWWVLLKEVKGFDRWLYLTKELKDTNEEARLFHCCMCLFMCVRCSTSPPWTQKATSMPEFRMEIAASFFFKGQSEALFILLLEFNVILSNQRLFKHSHLSQCTVYVHHFPTPTGFVTLCLFTKCHFCSTSLLC